MTQTESVKARVSAIESKSSTTQFTKSMAQTAANYEAAEGISDTEGVIASMNLSKNEQLLGRETCLLYTSDAADE